MPDNKIQTALLSLLRLGLWGREETNKVLPLSKVQWLEVYDCAKRHTVEGVVFDSFQYLPVDLMPPRDLLIKWTVKIDQIERHNEKMNACIKEQLDLFEDKGIYPVLLKGQGVAACYDIPNHRVCGDVDWYFQDMVKYRKANEVIRQRGIDISYTAGFSTEYMWKGVVIEHHQRMFDVHNPFCTSFLKRLQKQFYSERVKLVLKGNTVLLPAPILMMLQVNVHILKHLLSFGVGLRQLCDSARVYHTYQVDVDGQELKKIYQKIGILRWIHLLHAVLVKFIGLPLKSLPFELPEGIEADWMLDEIWMSGNFGFFDSRFGGEVEQAYDVRNKATRRIWANLRRYFKFAPMEAISFPLVQFYSKFAGK